MELFVFDQQVLLTELILSVNFRPLVPWGGARGQNVEHLKKFSFIFLSWNHLCLNKRERYDFLSVTSDHRFQYPRMARGLGSKFRTS